MSMLPGLYKRSRKAFLACDEFNSNESLRAVFTTSELSGYGHKIPEGNTREQRVDRCLEFLHEKQFRGEPTLALFTEILSTHYPADDALHIELRKIAIDIRITFKIVQVPHTLFLSSIDVGIIIALKEEFKELLDNLANTYRSDYDRDLGIYYYHFQLGVANENTIYQCVATFVGGMGEIKAALATERLISKWRPHALVILGIAASLESEMRLGDVVVADQIDMYLENAKVTPAEETNEFAFQLSGEVYRSSHNLCVAANHFEFAHQGLFSRWQDQCAKELQQLPLTTRIAQTIINKQFRPKPQIHVGHLASGPAVGASLAFKNWLKNKRDRKHLALEMESGGFMTAIHERGDLQALVLRAISDYGDEQKKKLDKTSAGAFRLYAVHNAVRLLQNFFAADIFRPDK